MSALRKKRVVVGMSGGVDSSVAAYLLQRQDYDVHGLFMVNWEEDEEGYCTAAADYRDAATVCGRLGIPLHRANFAPDYRERVFAYFLREYQAGRTPNPDVLCNREIKFGVFLNYARRLGAELIATGHYARVRHGSDATALLKGLDQNKDQSYFLHAVDAAALAQTLFPVGELAKSEVRAIAREQGFVTHDKRDSTGICFIGERNFAEFLNRYVPAQPGTIETPDGVQLGRHNGLMFYTLGQRKGLGIGGRNDGAEAPWYVAAKDTARNVLIVVQQTDHPLLTSRTLSAGDVHWIAGTAPQLPLRCHAKARYRQRDQACAIVQGRNGHIEVIFDEPQRALTPGQFVVFYDGDYCLGGATIEQIGIPAVEIRSDYGRGEPAISL
ncbi:MAG: tRNA 2-thiouridine(34) synthase MnmA [Chromatiales bacterium]|jgi:tRNA-specific 2-thiouridylase